MNINNPYFKLGASLYMPATHKSLSSLMNNGIANERSMVVCTEDAVSEPDLKGALENLSSALIDLNVGDGYAGMRFIRPRNPEVFKEILMMPGIEKIDGFVLPKATVDTIQSYKSVLSFYEKQGNAKKSACDYFLMPTLETMEVLWPKELKKIRWSLDSIKEQVPCVRIGGNDLMGLLSIKRMHGMTIYETPIRSIIDNIILEFRSSGYEISAPVFDYIDDKETLVREMAQDLNYGLYAKTAIHPSQVAVIDSAYKEFIRVNGKKALSLIDEERAVYREDGQMLEKTCHFGWAQKTKRFLKASSDFYSEESDVK